MGWPKFGQQVGWSDSATPWWHSGTMWWSELKHTLNKCYMMKNMVISTCTLNESTLIFLLQKFFLKNYYDFILDIISFKLRKWSFPHEF